MGFWDWFWLIYWVGIVPAWLVMSKFMLRLIMSDTSRIINELPPTDGDKMAAVLLGLPMAFCWPVGIPFAGIWKALESND